MICPEVEAHLATLSGKTEFVIFGLEAHVCVQQTTLDLLEQGFGVHLCVDAISSQQPTDRSCGLHRSERAGAALTSTESVMMELIRKKVRRNQKKGARPRDAGGPRTHTPRVWPFLRVEQRRHSERHSGPWHAQRPRALVAVRVCCDRNTRASRSSPAYSSRRARLSPWASSEAPSCRGEGCVTFL